MNSQLKNELAKVCELIDTVIREDQFPESIEPESLKMAVKSYPSRGGKRLRPALLLWSCGAVGGNPEDALHAAAAVEVYHNWTLVHDDIIDCDEFRRGVPTSHVELRDYAKNKFALETEAAVKYGTDFAILAGDVQQSWAMDLLLRSAGKSVSVETAYALAVRMQTFLNRGLISGEALDVEFEYRSELPSRNEAAHMIDGKTGILLAYSAASGAMIGLNTADHKHPMVEAVADYARLVGYAFQLCDDLLGVYGNEKSFGKPLCSDFREGKPTILAMEAFARLDGSGREKLLSLRGKTPSPDDVEMVRSLLDSCGARQAVTEEANAVSMEAMKKLHTLPKNHYRDLLEDLAVYLLGRNV